MSSICPVCLRLHKNTVYTKNGGLRKKYRLYFYSPHSFVLLSVLFLPHGNGGYSCTAIFSKFAFSNKIICSAVQKSIALACKKGVISWDKKDLKKDRCKGWFASSNQVYIRGDLLQELVSIKLKKEVSKKLISDALYSDMLISKYKGRYSKSIPQSESNMRYYCINYKKLCEKCNPNNDTSSIFC